jgi:hypothetical protein
MDRLSTEAIDQRIDAFRVLLERVTGHLVELDADLTWQMLEQSTSLRGRTAERWSDASQRHEALWRGQIALTGHLGRLRNLRGSRRSVPRTVLVELDELLDGDVVPMPAGQGASPSVLTEPLDHTELACVDVALRGMSDDYDIVAHFMAEVADLWGPQMERLDRLVDELSEVSASASGEGLRVPNELGQVSRAVDALIDALREDPVSVDAGTVSDLEARVDQLCRVLTAEREERPVRIEEAAAADVLIGQAQTILAAARGQIEQWEEKIVIADATRVALDDCEAQLRVAEQECQRLRQLQGAVAGGPLHRRVESLIEEVRDVVAAERRRLAERNEWRGVLSAYRAKANALGLAEDLEADRLYRRALETLYSAPCDLQEAARQVEAFRHLVPQRSGERS